MSIHNKFEYVMYHITLELDDGSAYEMRTRQHMITNDGQYVYEIANNRGYKFMYDYYKIIERSDISNQGGGSSCNIIAIYEKTEEPNIQKKSLI